MKYEDCKIGMKVKVTKEYDCNKNIVGEIGVVIMISPKKFATIQFIRNVQGCWEDPCGRSCWDIAFDCIEPADEVKLTNKQLERYAKSPHVRCKMTELGQKYNIPGGKIDLNLDTKGYVRVSYRNHQGKFFCAYSKCHPDDKFNINIGLELAFQRLAKTLGCTPRWTPKEREVFYRYVDTYESSSVSFYYPSWFHDAIAVAIGNCFKTQEEACKHKDEIMERYKKLIAYAKTLNK